MFCCSIGTNIGWYYTAHDHHKTETCVWNTEGHKTREIQ